MKAVFATVVLGLGVVGAAHADGHGGHSSATPEEVVTAIYEAFAAGDVPAFAAALHPEIIWNEAENYALADNNPYIGPDAVMGGVIGRTIEEWNNFTATPEDMIAEGDRVVVLGRYGGVHTDTGETINAQMVHVWTVRDGQAIQFQQYVDTLAMAEAAQAD